MHTLKAMYSNKKYPNISSYIQQLSCGCNSSSKFCSNEKYVVVVKALNTVVKNLESISSGIDENTRNEGR